MARRPGASYHVGLVPEQIVAEALSLTEESHLLGWSLRDLAQRCGVTVSVITHHVGAKDKLLRSVVAAALSELTPPPSSAAWEDWFRAMLHEIQPPLRRYPGTAKWVLLHGPSFPSILPMIDAGVATLQQAGFADMTGLAFATLFNNAVMTIAIADERLLDDGEGSRDHGQMMRHFLETGEGSPGVAVLDTTLMATFASGTAGAETAREGYYRFVIDTTIAGLAPYARARPRGR
ncbi:TetR/AcrR family transcriptional regulator [Leucobacter sp. M11]|uniref:TetR/AcrR family transcriptional regulator n=1 Tax=Leucobacter sp. M11 TaxID=2993565 RepID=UPI002D808046|nr:TetR/AcrR family transcriptional regulator [Leucobacter sp. M11]MEB4614921.1 TetR/AcrR family transcriptional regulator [Leucobacter sp. M11]